MLTLKELEECTGFTRDQLRRRLALLRPRLNGQVHRGPRGAILVEEEVAELLRELKALEDQGLGLAEALGALTNGEGSPPVAQGGPRTAEVALDELRRDLLIWRTWAIAATLGLVLALTLWGLR